MNLPPHSLDAFVASVCVIAGLVMWRWTRELDRGWARVCRLVLALMIGLTIEGFAFSFQQVGRLVPPDAYVWLRALGISAGLLLLFAAVVVFGLRKTGAFRPERRKFLQAAATAAAAVPVGVGGFAYLQRDNLRLTEVDLKVPSLPPGLHGLRIVQVSDLHMSLLVSERMVARAIDMANEAKAHIAVVTGDLVTRVGDPLDACLLQLKRLRASDGVYGCMGNHEEYADACDYVETAGRDLGIRFLRSEADALVFGNNTLNIAGVDHQRRRTGYLTGAEKLVKPGAVNLLLSHNPDVFPTAAEKGFDITLAGHTHGGQINLEVIHPLINVARVLTPYVHGPYEHGASRLYVTRGVGMIGIPARLGALPEVSVIRLCAT